MDLQKLSVRINGVTNTFLIADFHPEEKKAKGKKKVNEKQHHLFLIDRSGSMSGSINSLITQLKEIIKNLYDNDDIIVSVGWFSGEGNYDIPIRGASPTSNLMNMLDKMNSVIGLTCFSECLRESGKVIESIKELYSDSCSIVHFFSDGNPVTSRTVEQEIRDSVAIINDQVKNSNLIAFNTIGYTNFYEPTNLIRMSEVTPFGKYVHSSEINEYTPIIESNIQEVSGLKSKSIVIENFTNPVIFANYSTTKYIPPKISKDGKVTSTIPKIKEKFTNRVILVIDDENGKSGIGSTSKSVISINGEIIPNLKLIKKVEDPQTKIDVLFRLAYLNYYNGKTMLAKDIIVKNLKDKNLYDKMNLAFTRDEIAGVTKELFNASTKLSDRFKTGKLGRVVPNNSNAFCILDLFNILKQNAGVEYFPYANGEYANTTRRVQDELSRFKIDNWANAKSITCPMSNLVWNKDRMNLSLRFVLSGKVELNPKAADRVRLPREVTSNIYRTHTFIKDGNLHVKKARFLIPEKAYNILMGFESFRKVSTDYLPKDNNFVVNIDLSKLPIVNRSYLDQSSDIKLIFEQELEILKLGCKIKALKFICDERNISYKSSDINKPSFTKKYSPEQLAVLEEHGIRPDGIYSGIKNTTPPCGESDSYEIKLIKFDFKGFSTLPSLSKFTEMRTKDKFNAPGKEINVYYELLKTLNPDEILNLIQECESRHQELNDRMSLLKMAFIISGNHFSTSDILSEDAKGNLFYCKDEYTMYVKQEYGKEYF